MGPALYPYQQSESSKCCIRGTGTHYDMYMCLVRSPLGGPSPADLSLLVRPSLYSHQQCESSKYHMGVILKGVNICGYSIYKSGM